MEPVLAVYDACVLYSAPLRGYEPQIPTLTLPDEDDHHVLAAAIEVGAGVIVTFNLTDFPLAATAPHGVAAVHPDNFILALLNADQEAVWAAVRNQRRLLKNPPVTAVGMLETLRRQGLIRTTARLEAVVDRF